jgi:AmmeMemoRadiSam system protein B
MDSLARPPVRNTTTMNCNTSGTEKVTTKMMTQQTYIRRAHHAGSWYSNDRQTLDDILTKYLTDAHEDIVSSSITSSESSSNSSSKGGIPNACISPHAGYLYSGPTAAYVYLALKEAIRCNTHLRTVVVVSERFLCFLNE